MNVVQCPNCGTSSQTGQKFCAECGSPLPLACASCGALVSPGQKFCSECGFSLTGSVSTPSTDVSLAAVQASTSFIPSEVEPEGGSKARTSESLAMQEERRLVTALFCDLAGFTPVAEQLDPEEVRDMQSSYFGAMSTQVERYGGTVEKYAGDAVLALFGAPVAHEDDAERAVLCALGMQAAIEPVALEAKARWNVEPAIRVGVNTGEVVSGTWSASGRQDVAVTGDAVNAASRIQGAAEPGEVLVGTETMRLTRRRIRYGHKREVTLKGKVGTVAVYQALGLREQFGERWETSEAASPLVGRDRELVELLDLWVRAQGGEGQLVTVIGEAGVGKSRLVAELLDRVGAGGAVRVIRARCLSYGQHISLWLVVDLLRGLVGIREEERLEEIEGSLRVAVEQLLPSSDGETKAEALDVLGEVLGLTPGGSMVSHAGAQIRRQVLIRTLRLVFGALTERVASVLVLEDLHWIDEASEDVLTEVLSDVPGIPLLALSLQRPGWNAPWSQWGWTERMTLRPLRDEDAALLAGAVLGGANLSSELESYVSERAGGNPFFVEELLRALEDTGGLEQRNGDVLLVAGAAERLPSTLTEVLLARLDRLDVKVRGVAQVASVIGRTFGVRLLAEVMRQHESVLEPALSNLQKAEIAFPRRSSDLEYVFKHVSMRDVAYNTLVHKRREQLHLETARAIAALYPSDEYVEMIAYHYARTAEEAEAAEWLERAGDRATGVYATETAIGHYRSARERLARRGAEKIVLARLDEKLGKVLSIAGRDAEALSLFDQAAEAYLQGRDLEAAGRSTASMGLAHRLLGTPEEGLARVQPMVELLKPRGPSPALASLYLSLSNLLFFTGRYREQQQAAEEAAEIAQALGDARLLGEAEERRAIAMVLLGQPAEAFKVLARAVELIESGGDLPVLGRALSNLGESCKLSGDLSGAARHTERAVEVGARIGNAVQTGFYLGNLGAIRIILGEWHAAREALEEGLAIQRELPRTPNLSNALLYLGQLYLWEGDWQDAQRFFTEALELSSETSDRQLQENANACLAELAVRQGRPEEAVRRLEPLVGREEAELGVLLPILAWAQLALGDTEHARETVHKAVERTRGSEEMFLIHSLQVQGMVFAAADEFEEASTILAEARERARALPYPYAEAQTLAEEGKMNVRRGEIERGQAQLSAALEIFRRLGARKDIEDLEEVRSLAIPTG